MSPHSLNIKEIEEILPQRYPFLLIDKVLDYKENDYLIAVKNITGNEWALGGDGQGQLEEFPECLMIESALQAAIIFYHVSKNFHSKGFKYLIGKIKVEIKDSVTVGSVLTTLVSNEKLLTSGGCVNIKINEKDREIANLNILFSVKR